MLTFIQTTAWRFNRAVCKTSYPKTISLGLLVSITVKPPLLSYEFLNPICFFTVGCSHVRAWQYFVESIRRPEAFLAAKCEHTNNESKECLESVPAYMGFKADRRLRGKFFLETNSAPPFGKNFPI